MRMNRVFGLAVVVATITGAWIGCGAPERHSHSGDGGDGDGGDTGSAGGAGGKMSGASSGKGSGGSTTIGSGGSGGSGNGSGGAGGSMSSSTAASTSGSMAQSSSTGGPTATTAACDAPAIAPSKGACVMLSMGSGAGGGGAGGGSGAMCTGILAPGNCSMCVESNCCQELADCNADDFCLDCITGNADPQSADCMEATTQGLVDTFFTCYQPACEATCNAAQCNPVTDEGCDIASGEACDTGQNGFACFPPPNDEPLCSIVCDEVNGPYCSPTMTCLAEGECARYCCNDGDCGTGHCDFTRINDPNVGVCLQ